MTNEALCSDMEDVTLLRAAAQKIRDYEIPHVISEDEWVARNADNLRGILYEGDRFINMVKNLYAVKDVLLPSKESKSLMHNLFGDNDKGTLFQRIKMKAFLASSAMKENNLSRPDAEVDGNLVHWMEHAGHIALWSPVIAASLASLFDAEADAREAGFATSASEQTVVLAKQIVEKKVWDNSPQLRKNIRPYWQDALELIPSVKSEYYRRIRYMRFVERADNHTSRVITHQFGLLPKSFALHQAQQMRSEYLDKANNTSSSPLSRDHYALVVKTLDSFIKAVLDTDNKVSRR